MRLEVVVWRCDSGRSSMHVQSHSEWAPANIGPYSQAYTVSMQGALLTQDFYPVWLVIFTQILNIVLK